jgi:pantoate--beta-alanine ligase
MNVYTTKNELSLHLYRLRTEGKPIGFVPTMGALHKGHASLINRSVEENVATVVSIFINPTQFNDPSDLEKYPRTPEKDLELLDSLHVDVVFQPDVKEMYPEPDHRIFDLRGLDSGMEGAHREGHFNGVVQIVSKLFQAVMPNKAYFGQKDFQQLVVIRHMTELLTLDVEIVPCPIIREPDGLAMSSRNVQLGKSERETAPFIYQTLRKASELKAVYTPSELKSWVHKRFDEQPDLEIEYFEIVEDKSLRSISSWFEPVNKVGCIAVLLGGVRLIDNMIFN